MPALRKAAAVTLAALATPLPAFAHHAAPDAAGWLPDLPVVLALALPFIWYAAGARRLWARSSAGRGLRRRQAACFAAGCLLLAAALLPPLHRLGESLFSAHMVEHELIMVAAAPLLVLGRPTIAFLWALRPAARRAVGGAAASPAWRAAWRLLSGSLFAWILHGAVLWAWHLPALFEAALRSEGLHALQHASFLAAALLYWTSLFRREASGAALLSLFATTLHTGLLGALMTLGTVPWYPDYGAGAADWGLEPIEDQQLAGLVMWVPGGLVYTGAALALTVLWLRGSEASARRWEATLPHLSSELRR